MRSLRNNKSLLLSIFSLAVMVPAIISLFSYKLPTVLAKAGRFQFLTNLALICSIIVFIINIIAYITNSKILYQLQNVTHSIALTMEMVVSIVYWPTRILYIDLIAETRVIQIPLYLDISIHLLPVIFLIIDYYCFMPKWILNYKQSYLICSLLGSAYWVFLHSVIDQSTSRFPYPFLNVPFKNRLIIFIVVVQIAFLCFVIQKQLYNLIVGKDDDNNDNYNKKEK
ncbi:hypothetical protein PACTADRAFT_1732 [Pachysolen tannophilus NRRL Y-2460]|uniref:FAR-17a/AIG1-like protein n=1 Tax=Pachysolen tannophilus NRRL Y-2460 TaxID=669874 RepID=A0A1E4TZF8_PACTA|nr:hypothetical protein PACTADRAFT_1732 [Pachysolen tannophilus NRRL Y-2460]